MDLTWFPLWANDYLSAKLWSQMTGVFCCWNYLRKQNDKTSPKDLNTFWLASVWFCSSKNAAFETCLTDNWCLLLLLLKLLEQAERQNFSKRFRRTLVLMVVSWWFYSSKNADYETSLTSSCLTMFISVGAWGLGFIPKPLNYKHPDGLSQDPKSESCNFPNYGKSQNGHVSSSLGNSIRI